MRRWGLVGAFLLFCAFLAVATPVGTFLSGRNLVYVLLQISAAQGGKLSVDWHHSSGVSVIAPGQRVTFFMSEPAAIGPAALVSDRVSIQAEGEALRCEAIEAGQVSWSGARFQLGKGTVMRLDPMLGDPFGEAKQQAGGPR